MVHALCTDTPLPLWPNWGFFNVSHHSTQPKGRQGEDAACAFLQRLGFLIIERNVLFRFGEIDIVAKEGEVLVFVEVRSRTDARFGDPKATVSYRKQQRLWKAAQAYLKRLEPNVPFCRFDVVSLIGYDPVQVHIEHVRNAFQMEWDVSFKKGQSPWKAY